MMAEISVVVVVTAVVVLVVDTVVEAVVDLVMSKVHGLHVADIKMVLNWLIPFFSDSGVGWHQVERLVGASVVQV